jgi:hypothetical protein
MRPRHRYLLDLWQLPHQLIEKEMSVLDIVYVLAAVAVFAVIGLVARGVEKL